MGLFSGSKSSSTQSSYSGLRGRDMTNYNAVANQVPGDYDFLINNAQSRIRNNGNVFNVGANGLAGAQMNALSGVGQNVFANLGMNVNDMSPLVNSAVLNSGSAYLDAIGANNLGNAQAADNRFGQLNRAMGNMQGLLGNQGAGEAKTSAPGLGYHMIDQFAQGYAGGLTMGMAKTERPSDNLDTSQQVNQGMSQQGPYRSGYRIY
jgi:hypothetical protein